MDIKSFKNWIIISYLSRKRKSFGKKGKCFDMNDDEEERSTVSCIDGVVLEVIGGHYLPSIRF